MSSGRGRPLAERMLSIVIADGGVAAWPLDARFRFTRHRLSSFAIVLTGAGPVPLRIKRG
jgi:hypothetical protein